MKKKKKPIDVDEDSEEEKRLIAESLARTPEDMRGLPVFGQITKRRPWKKLEQHNVSDGYEEPIL